MRAIGREFNQSETTFILTPTSPAVTVRLRSDQRHCQPNLVKDSGSEICPGDGRVELLGVLLQADFLTVLPE